MHQGKSLRKLQRSTDRQLYPWAIASLILTVAQYMFSLDLIGVGIQYHLWITWIPMALGLLVLTIARWSYLMARNAATPGVGWKVLLWAFMLVQGLLFSHTSFGLAARFSADMLNRVTLRTGEVNYEQHPIHEAFMQGKRGRRQRVTFFRNGRREQVRPGFVPELADQRWEPPFDIILRTTPGILGTTILLDYSWVRVERDEQADQ
jgi:hypothetical protein